MNNTVTSSGASVHYMRLTLTVTHLMLVSLGSVNLLVILIILLRPYMRSITNVYMIGLCLADFIYLVNLTLVAATQLNQKSWAFGSTICTLYHGTETTGKYASVLFVVLLAADRYCAMCKASLCARYRTYRVAVLASSLAWFIAIAAATPLYRFAEVLELRLAGIFHRLCIAKWPSSDSARWYIMFSSILIFVMPLALIGFFNYHIMRRLREALRGSKRMQRAASSRAPYHRVTRLVLWVVVFHIICWSPFWLFNLFSSILRLRIQTQFDRIVVNIIHLFPYVNCALNPFLYAIHAENFRTAFRSLFLLRSVNGIDVADRRAAANLSRTSCYRPNKFDHLHTLCTDASECVTPQRNLSECGRLATSRPRVDSVVRSQTICAESPDGNAASSPLLAPFSQFIVPALSECHKLQDWLVPRRKNNDSSSLTFFNCQQQFHQQLVVQRGKESLDEGSMEPLANGNRLASLTVTVSCTGDFTML